MNSAGGSPWKWIYVQIKHLNFQEFIANKTNNKTLKKKKKNQQEMTIYGSAELQFCMTCHPSYVFLKATIQSYFQKCLEPATGSVLYKKLFLKILQNCQSPFFNKDDLVKKGTLAQVFSCEFCEIFTELQTTASKYLL